MTEIDNKLCRTCKYGWNANGGYAKGEIICDYLLRTGKMRNCDSTDCEKYEKKGGRNCGKKIKVVE